MPSYMHPCLFFQISENYPKYPSARHGRGRISDFPQTIGRHRNNAGHFKSNNSNYTGTLLAILVGIAEPSHSDLQISTMTLTYVILYKILESSNQTFHKIDSII